MALRLFIGITLPAISIGIFAAATAGSLLSIIALFLLGAGVVGFIIGCITGFLTLAVQKATTGNMAKKAALFVGLGLTGVLSFHSIFNQLSDKFHACSAKELAASIEHPIPATYRSIRFDFPRDLAVTFSATADNLGGAVSLAYQLILGISPMLNLILWGAI